MVDSWGNAFWIEGAWKGAGGKIDGGEVTKGPDSPAKTTHTETYTLAGLNKT